MMCGQAFRKASGRLQEGFRKASGRLQEGFRVIHRVYPQAIHTREGA